MQLNEAPKLCTYPRCIMRARYDNDTRCRTHSAEILAIPPCPAEGCERRVGKGLTTCPWHDPESCHRCLRRGTAYGFRRSQRILLEDGLCQFCRAARSAKASREEKARAEHARRRAGGQLVADLATAVYSIHCPECRAALTTAASGTTLPSLRCEACGIDLQVPRVLRAR